MTKLVLITGVASGIGAATAQTFASEGWKVIGVDNSEIENKKLQCVHNFIKGDVSHANCWEKVFSTIEKQNGLLHALINNVAVQVCKPIIETSQEEWDLVMSVNLRSIYLSVRHVHSLIQKQVGAIVNVGSVHALTTSNNIAAYAASKGGLLALTRALAIEFAPHGIRVNTVLPGAVNTPMLHAGLLRGHLQGSNLKELLSHLEKNTPLSRIGEPREIAQAILFLADHKRSSFITGHALVVDGGATSKLSTE